MVPIGPGMRIWRADFYAVEEDLDKPPIGMKCHSRILEL